MRRNPPARRPAPIRLIPYGPGPSAEIAVHGSLAVALDSGPPPRARPPLGVVRPGAPDLTTDARLIARLVLEVLAGVRPYHHLAGRTTPSVFEQLGSLAARLAGRRTPRLRTVRVCAPAPDVAEVTATAAFGPRVQALALRLERDRGRWRCAAIETTVPPART
ncbi:Rv3235 family protein [Actinoallomurus purpureus]|uniref:Rv3235 family protein n=1 Tax=Actinoallomurus purpureus TaxID=478114 RepID=UPI002093CFE0|nr:Rv3235 family protein [Actinoallomurus purpureus]MCO6005925.1 Rv3235 family protein [Actinoallomurus purpureus]